jgi:SAM-dependent methyltransferase
MPMVPPAERAEATDASPSSQTLHLGLPRLRFMAMNPRSLRIQFAPHAARLELVDRVHDLEPRGAGRVIAAWRGLAKRHGWVTEGEIQIQLPDGTLTLQGAAVQLQASEAASLQALALREAGLADAAEAARVVAEPSFWEERYEFDDTGWDLGEAAPPLIRSLAGLSPSRALAVGCGKGHEVLALARRGFAATGVDFAPSAVEAGRAAARALGIDARFEQADVLTLPGSLGTFPLWVEHTCFCAIYPARRPDYVAAAARTLEPGGLLLGLFYAHGRAGGPPFTTDRAELERLFAPDFELASLEVAPDSHPRRRGEELLAHFRRRADVRG